MMNLPAVTVNSSLSLGVSTDGERLVDGGLPGELALAEKLVSGQCQKPLLSPLIDRGVIRASGAEAADFLQNLLTNDIKAIAPGQVRLAGFCTPKGRLLALFHVVRDPAAIDDFLLILPAGLLAPMLKKLSMYVLRSKLKLTDATTQVALFGVASADRDANAVLPAPTFALTDATIATGVGAPMLSLLVVGTETVTAQWTAWQTQTDAVGAAAWRWLEIVAGVPRVVAATQEAFVPQMLNMELLAVNGVNFRKGCYPGQEIVARTQYLGKIKRRMFRAHLDQTADIAAGADVFAPETGEQHCGTVVSVAPCPSGGLDLLVCVQTGAVEAGEVRVGSLAGPRLSFLDLPYSLDGPDTRSA
jgi:folate-binding protein YgfZ